MIVNISKSKKRMFFEGAVIVNDDDPIDIIETPSESFRNDQKNCEESSWP